MRAGISVRALALFTITTAALSTLVACGGGGGGGGGGGLPPTQPPAVGAVFTPDGPAGNNSIALASGQGGGATSFVLDVVASGVSDLYGVSFDLQFPRNAMTLRPNQSSEGTFLSGPDDARTELIIQEQPAGTLVIGYSRLGQAGGVDGSGRLFSLEFALVNNGSGPLALSQTHTIDPFGETQSGVTWVGGSIVISLN